jgi:hypothetical protein
VVIALIGEASKHPTLIGEMVEVSRRMRVGDCDALRREVDRIKEALTVVDKKLRNCAEAVANYGADALREALIRRAATFGTSGSDCSWIRSGRDRRWLHPR